MKLVGVLGGGQLGRMLALAGIPLGLGFRFLDPDPDAPAGQVAEQLVGDYDDPRKIDAFATDLDVVTYEFENVSVERAEMLERGCPVYPPPQALAASQDRLAEKTLLRQLGVPTAPFAPVVTAGDLDSAIDRCGGYPCLLKTRRFGYDGKGQYLLQDPDDRGRALAAMSGAPAILEGFVDFRRELSLLAVRGRDGGIAFYPLVENHHAGGILRLSLAPAPRLSAELQEQGERHVRRLLENLAYVGVLAVEFFECDGRLVANEMAPRVHNSGHWTIEGAATSQFENHLRAVVGWPLGSTEVAAPCAMLNLIGELPAAEAILAVADAHPHLYGKAPRPGRKLGHITVRAATENLLARRLSQLQALLK